jgi:hypothetical protein
MADNSLHLELTTGELAALYTMVKHGIPFAPRSAVQIAVDILERLRPQLHAQNVPDEFINRLTK